VFGPLRPIGAGKTKLIHILVTLLKPTYGTPVVNGFDIVKDSSKFGIVFQAPSSDDLHSMLYGVPDNKREENPRGTRIGRINRKKRSSS
jgi:ABC-2 type transport system ATP-binding protein